MGKFRLTGRRAAGIAATAMMAGGLFATAGVASAATTSPAAVTSVAGQAGPAVPIAAKPVFTKDTPPLRVSQGAVYGYHFAANGRPFPTYALVGAPRWLSINHATGQVAGRVPLGTPWFRYAVRAVNKYGWAQTRTFTVATAKLPQRIAFHAPRTGVAGKSASLVAIGGRSGRPVTFSVDRRSGRGVCQVFGRTVRYLHPGTCVIDANQAGNAIYAPAPTARAAILVEPAPRR